MTNRLLCGIYILETENYKASLAPEIQAFLTKRIGVLAKYSLFNATHSRDRKAVAKKGRTDYHFRLDPAQFTWGIFVPSRKPTTFRPAPPFFCNA